MCYNSKCTIKIESCIGGIASTTSAEGSVLKTDLGVRFDYLLDGDECTLTVNDSEVVQTRRGEQNIKMTFRKGEQTECFLESGGFSGAFTVFTHDLKFTNGRVLLIVYTLGEDKIKLTFTTENNYQVEK